MFAKKLVPIVYRSEHKKAIDTIDNIDTMILNKGVEARFDGKWVLKTNTDLPSEKVGPGVAKPTN